MLRQHQQPSRYFLRSFLLLDSIRTRLSNESRFQVHSNLFHFIVSFELLIEPHQKKNLYKDFLSALKSVIRSNIYPARLQVGERASSSDEAYLAILHSKFDGFFSTLVSPHADTTATDANQEQKVGEEVMTDATSNDDMKGLFIQLQLEAWSLPELGHGLLRLCESFSAQSRVYDILKSCNDIYKFQGYLNCLDLASDTSRHEEIIRRVWSWFESQLSARVVQRLRIVFAEEEVCQELGMDDETTNKIRNSIANDAMYIRVLTVLAQHQKNNISWFETIENIRGIVVTSSGQEDIWPSLKNTFDEWHESLIGNNTIYYIICSNFVLIS